MSVTSATRWSIMWLFVGVALAVPVDLIAGGGVAVEYVTVYLVERSLSLDNVFLFLLILSAFNVPEGLQRRLLLIGVAIAFGLRALAIVVGAELLERFSFVSYANGALLLVVALRMLRGSNEELNVEDSRSVRFIRRVLPIADEPAADAWEFTRAGAGWPRRLFALVGHHGGRRDLCGRLDSRCLRDHPRGRCHLVRQRRRSAGAHVAVRAGARAGRALSIHEPDAHRRLGLHRARLLLEEVVHFPPTASLAGVLRILGVGVALSVAVDRRRPPHPAEREVRRPPRCPRPPTEPVSTVL